MAGAVNALIETTRDLVEAASVVLLAGEGQPLGPPASAPTAAAPQTRARPRAERRPTPSQGFSASTGERVERFKGWRIDEDLSGMAGPAAAMALGAEAGTNDAGVATPNMRNAAKRGAESSGAADSVEDRTRERMTGRGGTEPVGGRASEKSRSDVGSATAREAFAADAAATRPLADLDVDPAPGGELLRSIASRLKRAAMRGAIREMARRLDGDAEPARGGATEKSRDRDDAKHATPHEIVAADDSDERLLAGLDADPVPSRDSGERLRSIALRLKRAALRGAIVNLARRVDELSATIRGFKAEAGRAVAASAGKPRTAPIERRPEDHAAPTPAGPGAPSAGPADAARNPKTPSTEVAREGAPSDDAKPRARVKQTASGVKIERQTPLPLPPASPTETPAPGSAAKPTANKVKPLPARPRRAGRMDGRER
jgi:hypothetical protein